MAVRALEDLIAWQLANAFKLEVYRLLRECEAARRDRRYYDQLRNAASSTEANIAEGYHRPTAAQFRQFLAYARGSHAEAETRLRDGIDRGYLTRESAQPALDLAKRTAIVILRLAQSIGDKK